MLPGLVVGLAINPPRLPEADVVLAVEVAETLAANRVAKIAFDDEDSLPQRVRSHLLQPFLTEDLLLYIEGDDFARRTSFVMDIPLVASFHKARESAISCHCGWPAQEC